MKPDPPATPDRAAWWSAVAAGVIVWALFGALPVVLVYALLPLSAMWGVVAGACFGTAVAATNEFWRRRGIW